VTVTLGLAPIAFVKATNESSYRLGFLQGVSGVELKGHHTQEFMSGYVNGSQDYWYDRGYAESINKISMSSHNTNYTAGYKAAIADLPNFGMNLGRIPTHNQKDFYLGIDQGVNHTDEQMDKSGIGQWSTVCSPGHTAEYCAGFKFGADWGGYARDGM
jgi:hypothetical protein